MAAAKTVWIRLRDVARHGLFIQTGLDILCRLGLEITPYYVVEETPDELAMDTSPEKLMAGAVPDLIMRYLEPGEIVEAEAMPDSRLAPGEAAARIGGGARCFGAWSGPQLVAFTWVHVRELDFDPCRRALAEDEAYLFGAKTVRAYRGKSLGPEMRRRLYAMLAGEGRNRLYSISYVFNTPAVRFKRKLKARFPQLHLYIDLWGVWRRDWLLRNNDAR